MLQDLVEDLGGLALSAQLLRNGADRRLDGAMHIIVLSCAKTDPTTSGFLQRKTSTGNTKREAIRCLKRQLARTVYTTHKNEPLLT